MIFMEHFWSNGADLVALFLSGCLSATLLPGSSEAGLIAVLVANNHPIWILLSVATLGNTLGGMINYWLGWCLPNKTFTANINQTDAVTSKVGSAKIMRFVQRGLLNYGYVVLLFSWLPIIGDPLCLMAGWLRMKWWPSCFFMLLGKVCRYSVLILAFMELV